MTVDTIWRPLLDELARWIHANRSARFWLRDDDTIEPTDALKRLLGLVDEQSIPLTLAVIPAHAKEVLDESFGNDITVAVHGWSHQNHAEINQKKQELGPHRPLDIVLGELQNGYTRLERLFPRHFAPVLVPPWNRIDPVFIPQLPELGFKALSVFGAPEQAQARYLPVINTHVDLMDWHGTGGCRDHGELVAAIVEQLQQRFNGSEEAIGILTHHLVHDESAWNFLRTLFEVTSETAGCRWVSIRELF